MNFLNSPYLPPTPHTHRGAFCQFLFRWIYYYGSNKSTGKKTGKTHLCAPVSADASKFRREHQSQIMCHYDNFPTTNGIKSRPSPLSAESKRHIIFHIANVVFNCFQVVAQFCCTMFVVVANYLEGDSQNLRLG